jgi:hypothetical protein
METAEWYRYFAEREVRGHSAAYEALALGIAADPGLLELIGGLPVRWISNEGSPRLPFLLPKLTADLPERRLAFLPALDGEPLAMAGPHGEWLEWLA